MQNFLARTIISDRKFILFLLEIPISTFIPDLRVHFKKSSEEFFTSNSEFKDFRKKPMLCGNFWWRKKLSTLGYPAIIPFHTACFANGSLMVKKVVPFGRIWLIYSNIHVKHKHYAIQVIFWLVFNIKFI